MSPSASRVQDNNTGKCYTVTGTTTDTTTYTNPIGQVTDLNVLGCPNTPYVQLFNIIN